MHFLIKCSSSCIISNTLECQLIEKEVEWAFAYLFAEVSVLSVGLSINVYQGNVKFWISMID